MPPTSLVVDILSDRQHTITSSIHKFMLIMRERSRSKLGPVHSHAGNLQTFSSSCVAKNYIVPTSPYWQHETETPMCILALVFLSILFNQ
jgi:hypothetical protein